MSLTIKKIILIIYAYTGIIKFTRIEDGTEKTACLSRMELIKQRLKWAEGLYKEQYGKKKSKK